MNAIENLTAVKARADSGANFERFIASRPAAGWSEMDIAEYTDSIYVLMGNNDVAALALFPPGAYPTAEHARQGARDFWAVSSGNKAHS